MSFLSSVAGSKGGLLLKLSNVSLPVAVMGATTEFNQNRATFNATVTSIGGTASVKFQYSTDSILWTDGATVTGVTGLLQSVSSNQTGLSIGTTYYIRAVVTNSAGSITTTISDIFTTWSLKTYTNISAGSYSVSIPSITGVAPVIYEMLLYGGGGGANYAGGGGGGYRLFSSHTSSTSGTQTITGSIGAGGAGGNGGAGTGGAGTGGSTSLTIGSSSWTATGGGAGAHPGSNSAPSGTGGSYGSGDNTSKAGGSNTYGYYYVSGYVYVCTAYDKYGINCTAGYYDTNQPIYAWDGNYYAGGGGGGTDAVGSNAYTQGSNSHNGGAGGAGGGAYGLRGGNGGGGRGTQSTGANGSTSGTGSIVGTGGQGWYGAGVAGGITFKYYGP